MPRKSYFKNHEEYLNWYRNYRLKNIKKLRKYYREYSKKWRKENGYHNEINSKKRYPEKEAARRILRQAVRVGFIKRQPCEVCYKTKNIHAHHNDYSEPLKVKWLCALHHSEFHKNNKSK